MSLWFNRGRAFVAAVSLLLAYAGYRYALDLGADSFAARAVYTAAVVLVPLNILVALLLPERGVSYHGDYRWLFIVAGEILLVAWIASSGRSALSGAAWQEMLEHWLLRSPPAPLLGRVLFCAAFTAAVWRAWPPQFPSRADRCRRIAVGQAGALVGVLHRLRVGRATRRCSASSPRRRARSSSSPCCRSRTGSRSTTN